MKIAIIGTGISGLGAAWLLNQKHDVHVFEENDYIGGHSNSVSGDEHADVDTGFIVYNEWTYPNLIALFDHLGVERIKTDMSFGVSLDHGKLEYSGDHLFAQKSNLFRPSHYRMLADIFRFYKNAPKVLDQDNDISLGLYLSRHGYSKAFINNHILPMAAAIWSTGAEDIKKFPVKSFVRFFVNHGLFLIKNRPQWWTVKGGSQQYVEKISTDFKEKIRLKTKAHTLEYMDEKPYLNGEEFDHIIMACHSDQALSILGITDDLEKQVLSSFPYAPNTAYLHTDESLMPKRKKTWSSWNYLTTSKDGRVCLTYWMNLLQPFIGDKDLFVTLNPHEKPDPKKTLKIIEYSHPQYTLEALEGWKNIKTIQGKKNVWFCGAWCGYGFHEDGLSSGLAVAESLDSTLKRPWNIEEKSPAGANCRV